MSSICKKDCSKCLFQPSCGGCSLCEASICRKNCGSCFALCFQRPLAAAYFNSLGGPEFQLTGNPEVPELEFHIPVLPDRLTYKPSYELMPLIGVHAGNAFARNGSKINRSYLDQGYNAALNLDPRTKAVLEFYVKDRTLEGFWDNRSRIYSDLKSMGFAAVISPNFSVYEDAPRLDHMYNIKRTTIVYNEMLNLGIPAVPDVSWFNIHDLDKWCKEITCRQIKTIAFSFQVVDVALKPSNIWRSYLLGFRYLCQNIPLGTRIIIAGVVSPFRVFEIFKAAAGHSLCILNQSAYLQSRRGMLSETRSKNNELRFDALFEQNVQYFNSIYTEMNRDCITNSQDSLFAKINSWDKESLLSFYTQYLSSDPILAETYRLNTVDLEMAFSLVKRQLSKRKIRIT